MNQASGIHILRMAFLAPAIVDFVLAALTVHRMSGIVDDSLVPRGQFAGAAFCWAVLLLAGMARPVERAWILLPTAIVIGCIGTAYLLGFLAGTVETSRLVLILLSCAAMIWLCWTGLRQARACRRGAEFQP